ncbi:alkaline phosphatase family protein [Streptomyces sp. NBC_00879]|uniref:alkaline phosphatase family protein n=1 Tax=Streptomyces sp. NBC_00879 TaxID=2975855 RepID=UPI00386F2658
MTVVSAVFRPDHVVVVVFENKDYSDIIGSPNAPYINSLASQGAKFTQSFGRTHPSQPNYIALFSGTRQGVADDSCPVNFTNTANLGSQLLAAGLTFKGYSEGLPSTGYTGCSSGRYQRKHAPWVDFDNVPAASNVPFSTFPTDYTKLPTVSFVTPDMCNDMHDCSVSTGDTWLQNKLGGYAQWAKTHNSLLIVTFDEDNFSSVNQIATIFVGEKVLPGSYPEQINHYNVLRTIEDAYGLTPLNNAGTANPITDVWTGGSDPVVSGRTYSLRLSSGEAMDDPNSSTAAGTQLVVWDAHGGSNQSWVFTRNSDATYAMKNAASGLCADVSGSSTEAGAEVIQWPCTGNDNQRWSLVARGSGHSLISKHSGLAVTAGAATDGSPLTQTTDSGTSLQTWSLTEVG